MTQVRVLYAVTDPITALSFLRGQLAFLRANGFECHLACGRTPELTAFAEAEGVVLHDTPLSRKWLSIQDLTSLLRAVKVLRDVRPNVLNYSTPKAAMVWAVASWFGRPSLIVFLLRGLRLDGERPYSLRFALLWLMELLAARTAHVTVCVSNSLHDRALKLRLMRASRAHVLGHGSSNGVDVNRFTSITPSERIQARERLGMPESAFVVGFVGRLGRDKGILDLLDAVDECRAHVDARLVLVGPPEEGFDLDAALRSWPAMAMVTIHRPATTSVEREYAAFDVLALPSRREGMSNVLLEGQARGLPCVTTDAIGCADAIEPGVSGLVVPAGDRHALALSLRRLATDGNAESRRAMGAAGRARVSKLFQPEEVWRHYVVLYRGPRGGE